MRIYTRGVCIYLRVERERAANGRSRRHDGWTHPFLSDHYVKIVSRNRDFGDLGDIGHAWYTYTRTSVADNPTEKEVCNITKKNQMKLERHHHTLMIYNGGIYIALFIL